MAARITLYGTIAWELLNAIQRKYTRNKVFLLAEERAKSTGKKLLVIDNPENGFSCYAGRLTSFTIDPDTKTIITHKETVEQILPTLDLDQYVIFESCVFEYVEDFSIVKRYLQNVSPEDLYFTQMEPWSLSAYLNPGFLFGHNSVPKRVFMKYPPYNKFVAEFSNPFAKYNNSIIASLALGYMYFASNLL